MLKYIKEQWITALRSGRYKQGKHELKTYTENGIRYCCLGVLCNMLSRNERIGKWVRQGKWCAAFNYYNEESTSKVPTFLRQSLDITKRQENQLVELNDSGKTFHEIADWIEKHL